MFAALKLVAVVEAAVIAIVDDDGRPVIAVVFAGNPADDAAPLTSEARTDVLEWPSQLELVVGALDPDCKLVLLLEEMSTCDSTQNSLQISQLDSTFSRHNLGGNRDIRE